MSSASPGSTHRKPTRRPGRKAPSLRPGTITSGTAGIRVVNIGLLPTESEEREVLEVGSIPGAILPSCQYIYIAS